LSKIPTRRAAKLNKCPQPEVTEEGKEEWRGSSVTTGMITVRRLCSDRSIWCKRIYRTRGRTLSSCRIITTRRELRRRTCKLRRTKNCLLTSKWARGANLKAVYRTKILHFKTKINFWGFLTTNHCNNRYDWLLKLTKGIRRALSARNILYSPSCFIPTQIHSCSTSVRIPKESKIPPLVKLSLRVLPRPKHTRKTSFRASFSQTWTVKLITKRLSKLIVRKKSLHLKKKTAQC
jgi:hypothetical protein